VLVIRIFGIFGRRFSCLRLALERLLAAPGGRSDSAPEALKIRSICRKFPRCFLMAGPGAARFARGAAPGASEFTAGFRTRSYALPLTSAEERNSAEKVWLVCGIDFAMPVVSAQTAQPESAAAKRDLVEVHS
jgi:hypothetical protein